MTLLEGYEDDAEMAALADSMADEPQGSATFSATSSLAESSIEAPDGVFDDSSRSDDGSGGSAAEDPNQERSRRMMQQLRSMIEWGRSTIPKHDDALSDEVSVIIWPGAAIEYLPRGSTVGQIVEKRGLVNMEPEALEDASVQYWSSKDMLVNVNNRLVPESTVLNDGDLVILAREKMEI
eukprot:gene16191-22354_t